MRVTETVAQLIVVSMIADRSGKNRIEPEVFFEVAVKQFMELPGIIRMALFQNCRRCPVAATSERGEKEQQKERDYSCATLFHLNGLPVIEPNKLPAQFAEPCGLAGLQIYLIRPGPPPRGRPLVIP